MVRLRFGALKERVRPRIEALKLIRGGRWKKSPSQQQVCQTVKNIVSKVDKIAKLDNLTTKHKKGALSQGLMLDFLALATISGLWETTEHNLRTTLESVITDSESQLHTYWSRRTKTTACPDSPMRTYTTPQAVLKDTKQVQQDNFNPDTGSPQWTASSTISPPPPSAPRTMAGCKMDKLNDNMR